MDVTIETPLSPFVIKVDNFLLYSAAGCILPYLSTYLTTYTQATPSDVGAIMLASSLFGTVLNLVICTYGDRHRAHRQVYLFSCLLTYFSFVSLLVPILASWNVQVAATVSPEDDGYIGTNFLPLDTEEASETQSSTLQATSDSPEEEPTISPRAQVGFGGGLIAFYLVGFCIALGSSATAINMNLSDSFTTNIARRCSLSFGSIRFWGSVGWMCSSFVLSFVNQINWLPFLLPTVSMFVLLATVKLLLLLYWPDKRPFNLVEEEAEEQATLRCTYKDCENLKQQQRIKYAANYRWPLAENRTISNCFKELQTQLVIANNEEIGGGAKWMLNSGIKLVAFSGASVFDTKDEDKFRNVRRCSLAPLGDSYLISHFELNHSNCHQAASVSLGEDKTIPSSALSRVLLEAQTTPSAADRHFNYVAKIEPIKGNAHYSSCSSDGIAQFKVASLMASLTTPSKNLEIIGMRQAGCEGAANKTEIEAVTETETDTERAKGGKSVANCKTMSLRLHLKIIELIARRDRNMVRFMVLFITIGFVRAMNSLYLIPYLASLDPIKFKTLAAYVMISGYLSETLFYFVSARLTRLFSHSMGLSAILLIFAARYGLYLIFSHWPQEIIPLEFIVALETLQALNNGWFTCIYNESSLEFALEARECVDKLIQLGYLSHDKESLAMINNGVKMTLLGVASCCFDGIGIAFGSLAGGWLIDARGFCFMWTTGALVALCVGALNALVELATIQSRRQPVEKPAKGGGSTIGHLGS